MCMCEAASNLPNLIILSLVWRLSFILYELASNLLIAAFDLRLLLLLHHLLGAGTRGSVLLYLIYVTLEAKCFIAECHPQPHHPLSVCLSIYSVISFYF